MINVQWHRCPNNHCCQVRNRIWLRISMWNEWGQRLNRVSVFDAGLWRYSLAWMCDVRCSGYCKLSFFCDVDTVDWSSFQFLVLFWYILFKMFISQRKRSELSNICTLVSFRYLKLFKFMILLVTFVTWPAMWHSFWCQQEAFRI